LCEIHDECDASFFNDGVAPMSNMKGAFAFEKLADARFSGAAKVCSVWLKYCASVWPASATHVTGVFGAMPRASKLPLILLAALAAM
jgi:hypothetical protein